MSGAATAGAGDVLLRGIVGACLTPFAADGEIDEHALEAQVDFLVEDCCAVAIAAVEAAEYAVLSTQQRRRLIERGTELVAGRRPVIAGVSAPAVRDVLTLAELAASSGADLVQVLMPARPWGGEPSTQELVRYFSLIAEECPLPIVAYHNPASGADPSTATWVALAELPQVHYFKESSRDASKISRLIEEIQLAGHAGYLTTMQPLLMSLALGASGATMPAPATRIGGHVFRAFESGDLAAAAAWQRAFGIFPGAWSSYGLVPVMKAAMRHFGVDIGDPSPPYLPMSSADDSALGAFLAATGALSGEIADVAAATAALRRA